MPEKQKVYCGMKQQLPQGYNRFAIPYQCLKKGYGACLYANRRGECRGARYEEPFFRRAKNQMLFLLFLLCLFAILFYFLYKLLSS